MASNEPSGKVQSNFRRGFRSNALMGFKKGRKKKKLYKKNFLTPLRFAWPCLKEEKKYENQFAMHQETIMPYSRVIKKNLARFEYRYRKKRGKKMNRDIFYIKIEFRKVGIYEEKKKKCFY